MDGIPKLEKLDKKRTRVTVPVDEVRPFVYDTELFEGANKSKLIGALKKEQQEQQIVTFSK